jgi:hypothetical protein
VLAGSAAARASACCIACNWWVAARRYSALRSALTSNSATRIQPRSFGGMSGRISASRRRLPGGVAPRLPCLPPLVRLSRTCPAVLAQIASLRDAGVLTDAEYDAKRAELMAQL